MNDENKFVSNVVICTAGHIDHGKTALIKALSGIETDTTLEEKERGISINLGFAYFDLPSGKRCGVVDVPGHEKFIKNMLAGVSGINLVLLLVDAREGIMPQTKEHIDILSLLGIENYIIVITKIDLVDEDYIEFVREDVEKFIKETILENSPIIEVDSISRKGIDKLLKVIDEKTKNILMLKESKNSRINVDRAFQVKGFGTVITGTLLEGKISVGDELEIYPNNIITKVRNIQVHETDVKTAFAGQRTAINLNNIKVEEVCRGTILATPGTLIKTYMIDVEIKIINNSDFNLKLWDRVRVYIGTREVMARVVPLGTEIIKAGKNEFAQLRLEEEISVKNYDKFIIRTYSPMVTIGGGIILDAVPKKHNRFNEETLNKLKIQLQGDSKDLIESYLLTDCRNIIKIDEILKNFNEIKENILLNLKRLVEEKIVYETSSGYLHMKKYEDFKYKISKIVNEYHIKNKLRKGIVKAELLSKFKTNQKEIITILDLMISNKNLKIDNNFISLFDFEIKYDVNQIKHKNRMEKSLLESEFLPIGIKELTQGSKEAIEVLESLIGSTIVRLDGDIVIHEKAFKDAKSKVLNHFKNNKKILLSEFRDMIGSSRKYSLALLEYMDRLGITKRVDDYRVLGNNT